MFVGCQQTPGKRPWRRITSSLIGDSLYLSCSKVPTRMLPKRRHDDEYLLLIGIFTAGRPAK
jgi:hypothetical protein